MTILVGRISGPLIVLAAMAGVASSALAQSFTLVGRLPEGGSSVVFGLSANGRAAAGWTSTTVHGDAGFRWTAEAGRNDFGLAMGSTQGYGMSGDGLTVVGDGGPGSGALAFRWSATAGYQNLGTMPGFTQAEARDANFDGSIIAGTLRTTTNGTPQAFRWTQGGGMQGLGVGTRAEAISGDGSTVVGSTGPIGNRPFTWTSAGGVQFLPTIDGTTSGYAFATNNTGNIVVGRSGANLRTTMWTNSVPVELLSSIPNLNVMTPYGVSDDGSVVAGQMSAGFAAVWTPSTGIVRLSDYLVANGVALPVGVVLESCTAVSADGLTFAGYTQAAGGVGNIGFVATIPTLCPADLDNDGSLTNGGVRDRAVTIDDLLYLLTAFESGNLAADLDNGSNTGTRDNAVTIEDLLFFLVHFEEGC